MLRRQDECVFAAYDRFIAVLVEELASYDLFGKDWENSVAAFIAAYLRTLQKDLVVARAFQVEMDALGRAGRKRRRDALVGIAHFLRQKQDEWAPGTRDVVPLSAYIGAVYAVRQIASDLLDEEDEPDLLAQLPELTSWISRTLETPTDG